MLEKLLRQGLWLEVAKGLKVEAKGLDAWKDAGQVVFDAVKEAMDDIRDDVSVVTQSLTPRKTGKLEKSQYVRRYYKNLDRCYFTVSFKGVNKGFDYATWTHDARYNLGAGSRAKRPAKSRFARGSLRVGRGYLTQVTDSSEEAWSKYIAEVIDRKLQESIKKNGG